MGMIEIEYNKQKIFVPTSWDDVPLSKYETFYISKPVNHRERVELIALVCGVDSHDLRQWPVSAFNLIIERIAFIFADGMPDPSPVIDVDGVKYVVPIEDELSLGAWVDAETIQKDGVAVLSNVLAIVCRPAGEAYNDKLNEERAVMFAAMPASKILGVLSFFLQCRSAYRARTKIYTALKQVGDLLPPNIGHLLKRGGFIRLLRIWPIIRYYTLTRLLHYRLGRLLPSYSTGSIKKPRIALKGN